MDISTVLLTQATARVAAQPNWQGDEESYYARMTFHGPGVGHLLQGLVRIGFAVATAVAHRRHAPA